MGRSYFAFLFLVSVAATAAFGDSASHSFDAWDGKVDWWHLFDSLEDGYPEYAKNSVREKSAWAMLWTVVTGVSATVAALSARETFRPYTRR